MLPFLVFKLTSHVLTSTIPLNIQNALWTRLRSYFDDLGLGFLILGQLCNVTAAVAVRSPRSVASHTHVELAVWAFNKLPVDLVAFTVLNRKCPTAANGAAVHIGFVGRECVFGDSCVVAFGGQYTGLLHLGD